MKKIALLAVGALLAFAGVAAAQTVPVPLIGTINQNDAVQVIPRSSPSAANVYAPPGGIAGVEQYSYQVPLTAFAITVPHFVSLLYINPAGTLATGAITMMASPADGQKFCMISSQTQTAITFAGNTGQTISTIGLGAVTALTANTSVCWFFNGPLAAWIRTK